MNDPITPNPGTDAMRRSTRALDRLARWVEGLLDADRLLLEDGSALLRALASARRSLDGEDGKAARRHTHRFCRGIEALVQSDTLEELPGRAALEVAHYILTDLFGSAAQWR